MCLTGLGQCICSLPQHENVQLFILITSKDSVHLTCTEKPPDEVRLTYIRMGHGGVSHTEEERSHKLS